MIGKYDLHTPLVHVLGMARVVAEVVVIFLVPQEGIQICQSSISLNLNSNDKLQNLLCWLITKTKCRSL